MIVKECSKCGEEKPLSDFHKHKLGRYGVGSQCKKCRKEYAKQYYQENSERINEYYVKYCKQRAQSDPIFKLKQNLRCRTSEAFRTKGFSKKSKTKEMLGVEWEIVKKHIEIQFTKGMSWDNHGEWHIDHIIPLASAKTEEEVVKLCHYLNLQPLWAEDNISKSDSIEAAQVKLRL